MTPVKGKESTDYWCSTMKYTDEYAVSMKKAQGKEFKILALSDLQLNDALACFGMKGTAYSTAEKVIKE